MGPCPAEDAIWSMEKMPHCGDGQIERRTYVCTDRATWGTTLYSTEADVLTSQVKHGVVEL